MLGSAVSSNTPTQRFVAPGGRLPVHEFVPDAGGHHHAHLDHPGSPEKTMAEAERWAAGIGGPAYAIDDQTAIKVADSVVDIVSEGHWKLFNPAG
jgi:hypothetical protein